MKAPLIGLAISALLLVLGFGLCGGGAVSEHSNTQSTMVGLGLLSMALAAIGGLISVIWLVVALIRGK